MQSPRPSQHARSGARPQRSSARCSARRRAAAPPGRRRPGPISQPRGWSTRSSPRSSRAAKPGTGSRQLRQSSLACADTSQQRRPLALCVSSSTLPPPGAAAPPAGPGQCPSTGTQLTGATWANESAMRLTQGRHQSCHETARGASQRRRLTRHRPSPCSARRAHCRQPLSPAQRRPDLVDGSLPLWQRVQGRLGEQDDGSAAM